MRAQAVCTIPGLGAGIWDTRSLSSPEMSLKGAQALTLRGGKHLEGPLPTCWAVTFAFLHEFAFGNADPSCFLGDSIIAALG